MRLLFAAVALAAACLSAAAQDIRETRYHRVHLKNGNFVDGDVVKDERAAVVLRLKFGEMAIRRDLIDRIEIVRMRGREEAAPAAPPPPRAPEPKPAPAPRADRPPVPPAAADGPVQRLVRKLERAGPDEKYEVLQELVKLDADATPALVRLLGSSEGETREFAAAALVERKDPRALEGLMAIVKHPSAGARRMAAKVLGALGGALAFDALDGLLKDPEPEVRAEAVQALGLSGDRSAWRAVGALCEDPDAEVRGEALRAWIALSERLDRKDDLIQDLFASAERARDEAKADLLTTLGSLERKEIWARLVPFLTDRAPRVRAAAVLALQSLDVPESAAEFAARIEVEEDDAPRLQLALAARARRIFGAVPVLIRWVGEASAEVREEAVRSLRTLTGKDFGSDAAEWSRWWQNSRVK